MLPAPPLPAPPAPPLPPPPCLPASLACCPACLPPLSLSLCLCLLPSCLPAMPTGTLAHYRRTGGGHTGVVGKQTGRRAAGQSISARLGVDLDDGDVAAERERRHPPELVLGVQDVELPVRGRAHGELGPREARLRVAGDLEAAGQRVEPDVVRARLEIVRHELARSGDNVGGSKLCGRATELRRLRAVRAGALRDLRPYRPSGPRSHPRSDAEAAARQSGRTSSRGLARARKNPFEPSRCCPPRPRPGRTPSLRSGS